jgi:hypothetical protein
MDRLARDAWAQNIGRFDEANQSPREITRGKGEAHEPALHAVKAKFNLALAISTAQTSTPGQGM